MDIELHSDRLQKIKFVRVGLIPAFTMIELIFVIVIIGILSAVAIPRFAATRDDAQAVKVASDIMVGASDIASYAISSGKTESNLSIMSNVIKNMSRSGIAVVDDNGTATIKYGSISDCVKIEVKSDATDSNLSIQFGDAAGDSRCSALQSMIDSKQYPMRLRGKTVVY